MKSIRRIASVAVLLTIDGCAPSAVATGDTTIERWLTCTECVDGELAAVRALGTAAAPALRTALSGPSAQSTANMRRSSVDAYARARRQWQRMAAADRALRPLGDSASFITRGVENFRSMYQVRAAQALAAVDPSGVRSALTLRLAEDSLGQRRVFRTDVRRFVDSLARASP